MVGLGWFDAAARVGGVGSSSPALICPAAGLIRKTAGQKSAGASGENPAMFAPASLAEHTVESLYAGHGREQPWTYRLLLVGVIGALASLPFIKVDVSVRAPGMVRPAAERIELRLAVSGRVEQVLVRDNESVEAGQTLVVLASTDLDERLARNRALQEDRHELLGDLSELVSAMPGSDKLRPEDFHTAAPK